MPPTKTTPAAKTAAKKVTPIKAARSAKAATQKLDPRVLAEVKKVQAAKPGDHLILVVPHIDFESGQHMFDMLTQQVPGVQFTVLAGDMLINPAADWVDRAAQALHTATVEVVGDGPAWKDLPGEDKNRAAEVVRRWLAAAGTL